MNGNNPTAARQTPGQVTPDPPHCLLADASVFIGRTSIPMGDELRFLTEMEDFFAKYRGDLVAMLKFDDGTAKADFEKHMYRPGMYWLFGPFDLAALALIDDYEFACQTFHPLDPHYPEARDTAARRGEDRPQRHFAHRVIVGPCPRWDPEEWQREGLYEIERDALGNIKKGRKLVDLAGKTFLRGDPPCSAPTPLIGICRLEVNNSFLIGGGGNFLRCLVKATEAAFDTEFPKQNGDRAAHIIILEGYSWHELTLLVFGRSFEALDHFVDNIRRMTLLDVGEWLHRDARTGYREEWTELLKLSNLYLVPGSERPLTLMEWIDGRLESENQNNELCPTSDQVAAMKAYLKTPDPSLAGGVQSFRDKCLGVRPFGTHVFFNTTTSLGFSANLMKAALEKLNQYAKELKTATQEAAQTIVGNVITDLLGPREPAGPNKTQPWPDVDDKDKSLTLIRRWSMKAGHDLSGVHAVRDGSKEEFLLTSGRTDVVYPCNPDTQQQVTKFKHISSREAVEAVLRHTLNIRVWQLGLRPQELDDDEPKEPAAGVLSVQSTLGWPPEEAGKAVGKEEAKSAVQAEMAPIPLGHSSANQVRSKFCYSKKEVDEVFKALKKLRVPKVVVGRVLNALAQFNEGIQDNFLFSSFLELRPYTQRIVGLILDLAKGNYGNPAAVSDELNLLIDNFEAGWRNRFHGGWRLGELSDFNLEFKGGIQQLATAFHAAYRMLSWYHTRDLSTLAVVTGRPSITVLAGAVRLNLYDIFHPEFFCARAGHEASEQLLGLSSEDRQSLRSRLQDNTKTTVEEYFKDLGRLSLEAENPSLDEEGWRKWVDGLFIELGKLERDNNQDARYLAYCETSLRPVLTPEPGESASFFDQLYADMCNYRTVFLADPRLYAYWSVASFVVDPVNWQSPGVVDGAAAFEAAFRCATAMLAWVRPDDSQGLGAALRALRAYWVELLGLVEKKSRFDICVVFNLASKLLRMALQHGDARKRRHNPQDKYAYNQLADIGDWIVAAKYFAENSLPTKQLDEELAATETRLRWGNMTQTFAEHYEAHKNEPGSSLLHSYVAHAEDNTNSRFVEAYECLKSGRAYVGGRARRLFRQLRDVGTEYPFEAAMWTDFCDVTALMNAYLRLLKDGSSIDSLESGRMVLQRKNKGEQGVKDNEEGQVHKVPRDGGTYAELVFDPRGGSFTFSPEFRRKHFMWRSAFVMSLYDIAEKAKLVYCDQVFSRPQRNTAAPPTGMQKTGA